MPNTFPSDTEPVPDRTSPTADVTGPETDAPSVRTRWTPPVPGSRRRPLVPRWLIIAVAATIVVAAVAIGLGLWAASLSEVRVPSLNGLDRAAAEARLQEAGLVLRVGDRRFSETVPTGQVVDQSPAPGTKVAEGAVVTVALSAGTENFPLPDVVGSNVDAARRTLRDRGLSVDVQTVASDRPQGTVVESFPSPGVTVAAGDTVRLSVAAGSGTGGALLPSDLTGTTIVLDPAPMPVAGGADTTMDVARRLRALLEASGAKVVVTRDVTDSGEALTTLARGRRAKESSSTALVGFSVVQVGTAGLNVLSLPATGTTQPFYLASAGLATAVSGAFKTAGRPVIDAVATNDVILTGTGVPAVRVRLGSLASPDDKLLFADPQWADDVARSVYRAIGSVYGSK